MSGYETNQDMIVTHKDLKERIARLTGSEELVRTAVSGLYLFRREKSSGLETVMYEPSICLLAQGVKKVHTGKGSFIYDPNHFLVASVDFPTVVEVIQASPKDPCLGIVIDIDCDEVSELMIHDGLPTPIETEPRLGISVGVVRPELLDAVNRLVGLLDNVQDIPIMAPIIKREILYRLLTGEQGGRLRQLTKVGSQSHQISLAINWLKENFARPLRVDQLAALVNMSTSTFHHHFRALTAKSPLQYQKWLRLNEARRLMLVSRMDAATASFEVGYESPSQFSREYSRLFGNSPARDVASLREDSSAASP
jgi:AraC-like DNA-binding protein